MEKAGKFDPVSGWTRGRVLFCCGLYRIQKGVIEKVVGVRCDLNSIRYEPYSIEEEAPFFVCLLAGASLGLAPICRSLAIRPVQPVW